MAADDVARALMALEDPGVRSRVRAGDMGALGDVALSAKEEGLVRGAASEEANPDVEGFEWGSSSMFAATQYVRGNVLDGGVQGSFTKFISGRYGGIGAALGSGCVCPPMQSQLGGAAQQLG